MANESRRARSFATGAEYRRLPIDNLSRFVGAAVYFGATFIEARYAAAKRR